MTTTEPAASWDLVAAAQAGDAEAFGQLWTRYRTAVAQYIASRVHHRATTEDLTSEVFLKAWRAIGSVSYQGRDVSAWLITIARNKVTDYQKCSLYNRELIPRYPLDVEDFGLNEGPDVIVPRQRCEADAAEHLGRMVDRLPPVQRAVIRGRFYDGMSSGETAQRVGCSVPAVKSVQHRAVVSLALACRPARTVLEFTDGLELGVRR